MEFNSISKQRVFLADTNSSLKRLKLDIENYGAENWQRVKDLEGMYHRITNNLFLLCDLLETRVLSENKSENVKWFHSKINQLLVDEEIEEIPAKRGDSYNSEYYKIVDSRFDRLAEGIILEVIRKGYFKREKTETVIILRLVEVIVSKGSEGKPSQL